MVRIVRPPWPTTELGAAVVVEGLLDLGLGVHHERSVLRYGLADRAALQHHALDAVVAGHEFQRPRGLGDSAGAGVQTFALDGQP